MERIMVCKKVCLSEYDTFLMKAFHNMEQLVKIPDDDQNINHESLHQYKIEFSRAFKEFYHIYKKIVQKWHLSAFDIDDIQFTDIPCIKTVIDTFAKNHYYMLKKAQLQLQLSDVII